MKRNPVSVRMGTVAVLSAAFMLLVQSSAAAEGARSALKLCAYVLIPSLFPYMVISSLIVSFGCAEMLGCLLSPLCRLLHLPRDAAGAILLGALCGFPVGAKTACELYTDGRLTRTQTERLIAVANNTGPAFVIEVVGAHCWGSRGFGLTVYAVQILSALVIGAVYARVHKDPAEDSEACSAPRRLLPPKDVLTRIAEAVSSAAFSVLTVCGFVVFFAVSLTLLARLFAEASWILPPVASAAEFTSGVTYSAKIGGAFGAFLSGFSVGWSGISVFAQCKVFTSPIGVRLAPAAICKALQGIITGTAAALYFRFVYQPSASVSTVLPVADSPMPFVLAEVELLVLFCLLPTLFSRGRSSIAS
ncbi:MAG: hypothetical protein IJZ08_06710 [Clostridia bacterium]|nr:hypothetical protein [Clostridia bacterium]